MDNFRNQISKSLAAAGLGRIQPDIERLALPSIRLSSTPAAAPLTVGSSRLGGEPDLPVDFSWPAWQGVPMSFLAQIRLDELATFAPASQLPRTGMLLFFYDAHQQTYGADPSDRGGWLVAHLETGPETWQRRSFPEGLPGAARFTPCGLAFSEQASLPADPSQHMHALDWSEAEVSGYEDFRDASTSYTSLSPEERTAPRHRMFGYPDPLQDDMQVQCALYANGYTDLNDPKAAEALAHKEDWLLLLQLDSDYQAGMKWASAGRLYFWIERQALQVGRFDRCWLVLQSD